MTTVVLHAIADNDITDLKDIVIGKNLREDFLCNPHRWRFVLNDHLRLACIIVKDTVTPSRHTIQTYSDFVGKQ